MQDFFKSEPDSRDELGRRHVLASIGALAVTLGLSGVRGGEARVQSRPGEFEAELSALVSLASRPPLELGKVARPTPGSPNRLVNVANRVSADRLRNAQRGLGRLEPTTCTSHRDVLLRCGSALAEKPDLRPPFIAAAALAAYVIDGSHDPGGDRPAGAWVRAGELLYEHGGRVSESVR